MTYTVCKRLIEGKSFTEEDAGELQVKLDVFLLNNRIKQNEYEELTDLLLTKIVGD